MAEHADATEVSGSVAIAERGDEVETDSEGTEAEPQAEPEAEPATVRKRPSTTSVAIAVGVAIVVALSGVAGWLGYRVVTEQRTQATHDEMVAAARQGAVNLTSIDYATADADIERILDGATGTFHDDFQQRSQPFVDVVKQAQSKSEGTVTSAGLESSDGDRGQVLVAVSVKTSNLGAAEQEPRAWRMRIDVQKVDDEYKVANVSFVP